MRVVWVGKTKNPQLAKLCSDYIARIEHFLTLNIVEVKEPKGGMEAEAAKILGISRKTLLEKRKKYGLG